MKVEEDVSRALGEMPAVNGVPVLQFTKVTGYTTFTAEYAIEGGDLIFHFFLPPELTNSAAPKKQVRNYWEKVFPETLIGTCLRVFNGEAQRMKFDYVEDYGLDSWFFRAFGFGMVLAPESICERFLEALDQALDTTKKT